MQRESTKFLYGLGLVGKKTDRRDMTRLSNLYLTPHTLVLT